ncbi:MAG TPA: sugar ABC transporter [Planctomycetaceae bacterium]|nr:sugar ABC transporter [Planctomycetaceae bacterium]
MSVSTSSILSMSGITKRFGATIALDDVAIDVQPGQVLALIGENGAGKSTLMRILSGSIKPDSGQMSLEQQAYEPADPHSARLAGVSMIYQELTIAPDLSLEDNLMLGCESSRFGLLDRKAQRERMQEALRLLGLDQFPLTIPARLLSPASQQLVEIARALVNQSKIVIFDEPTSSLTSEDVQQLFKVIRILKERGLGLVYISHFLEEIRELCDDYVILRDGQSVGAGKLDEASDDQIVHLMIGRELEELFPTVPHEQGELLLDLTSLTGSEKPVDVSLQIRRGEIVGLAGLVGAGRTELARCLYGLDPVKSGTVKIEEIQPAPNPRARIRAGMGMVSEDRKTEGLAQNRSIADNLTLSRLEDYARFGVVNLTSQKKSAREWMNRLNVKAESPEQTIQALSGGNQQKVAIARVLHQQADLLILDEPTRGIDVRTKSEIYRLMGECAAQGKAVLFISSYLPELQAVCDRIGVMARGRLKEIRPTEEWTAAEIMRVAISK